MMVPDKIKNKISSPTKIFSTSSTSSSSTGLQIPEIKGEPIIKNEMVENEFLKVEINQNQSNDIKFQIKNEDKFEIKREEVIEKAEKVEKEVKKKVEKEVEKEEVFRPLGPIAFMQLHAGILDLSSSYDFSNAEVIVYLIVSGYSFLLLLLLFLLCF